MSEPPSRTAAHWREMAAGPATLVIMLSSPRTSLRLVYLRLAVNDWALRIRYWWLLQDKRRLLLPLLLGLIPGLLVVAIWQSWESTPPSAETREMSAGAEHRAREMRCLALNIYHEARGEPKAGQYAVAEVTMNRVASSRFPDTVCEVVHEKRWDRIRKRYVGAFSWTEIDSVSTSDDKAWARSVNIAEETFQQGVEPRVAGALFYHARHIRPSWARKKIRVGRVGRHIFYK